MKIIYISSINNKQMCCL